MVDWESEGENRAYASLYAAENIRNWRVERINGRNVLTLLVLGEKVESRKLKAEMRTTGPRTTEQSRKQKAEI